jgi:hypothetical protein
MVRPLSQRLHPSRHRATIHLLQPTLPGEGMATSQKKPEIERQFTLTTCYAVK